MPFTDTKLELWLTQYVHCHFTSLKTFKLALILLDANKETRLIATHHSANIKSDYKVS